MGGCAPARAPGGLRVCVHVQAPPPNPPSLYFVWRPRFLSTLKPYCTLTLKKPLARASTCFTIFTITTLSYCTFFYNTFYLSPSPGPPPVRKLTAIMRNVQARTFRAAIPGGEFFLVRCAPAAFKTSRRLRVITRSRVSPALPLTVNRPFYNIYNHLHYIFVGVGYIFVIAAADSRRT